jgi:hypothetical protein
VPSTLNGTIRRKVMAKKELRPGQASKLYSSSADHLSWLLPVAGMWISFDTELNAKKMTHLAVRLASSVIACNKWRANTIKLALSAVQQWLIDD